MRSFALAALPILALAACGPQSTMPPTSTVAPSQTTGASPTSKAPESANSLPNGAQVNAPLTPTSGNINNTQVGPSTRTRPRSTTGY